MNDNIERFIIWINLELEKRDWNQADLARRAGLTRGGINGFMNRKQKKPGIELLLGIAEAFNMPAESVFRKAGVLPRIEIDKEEEQEALYFLNSLPQDERRRIIDLMRFESERRKDDKKGGKANDNDNALRSEI